MLSTVPAARDIVGTLSENLLHRMGSVGTTFVPHRLAESRHASMKPPLLVKSDLPAMSEADNSLLSRRHLRARSMVYLQIGHALKPNIDSLKDAAENGYIVPTPCGRFSLVGRPSAVRDLLHNADERLYRPLRAQLPDLDQISREEFLSGPLAMLQPIPGPDAGWSTYPQYVLMVGDMVQMLGVAGLIGVRDATWPLCALSRWLHTSQKWVCDNRQTAIAVLVKTGYDKLDAAERVDSLMAEQD